MVDGEAAPDYVLKINQVKDNLKTWNPYEWVTFWVAIPALLFAIYSLPQSIKAGYFILNTSELWNVQTLFLSSYTHSQLYPHLVGNLAFYFAVLGMIFAFEVNRRRFRIMAAWSFLAVPFISSLLTILFWGLLGMSTTGQGFSDIIGALLAYAMFVFVVWGTQDRPEVFDHPEQFTGTKARYVVLRSLLAIILVLIVLMGIVSGIFTDAGGAVTNGIAHFGGFISSLVVLLVIDLRGGERRFFDTTLGTAILVGVVAYLYYLVLLVRLVRGQ
jgi:hypothetical protein